MPEMIMRTPWVYEHPVGMAVPSQAEAATLADALLSEIQAIGEALFHELPSDFQDLEYRAGKARWLMQVALGGVDAKGDARS